MNNKGRLKLSLWLMVTMCIAGFALWQTGFLKKPVAPEPLVLAGDEKIWGHLRLEAGEPDDTAVTIGRPFILTLEIEARSGIDYDLPDLATGWSDEFLELARTLPEQRVSFPEGVRTSRQYQLIAWRSGKFTLPNLPLVYRENGAEQGEILIPGQVLTVESLLPSGLTPTAGMALEIKGPKAPTGLPLSEKILYWHLGLAVGVWIAVALLGKIQRARQVTHSGVQMPLPEPAYQVALKQLDNLKSSPDLAKEDYVGFYTSLSQCFRRYMADQFKINGLEMTTEEFSSWARENRRLSETQQRVVGQVLSRADLVKFAKIGSTLQEALEALTQLEQFVLDTQDSNLAGDEGAIVESDLAMVGSIPPDGGTPR